MGTLWVILACVFWALDALIRYPLLGEGLSALEIVFVEHSLLTLLSLPILFKSFSKFWSSKVSDIFVFVLVGAGGSALATLAFTKAFSLINPSLVILLQKFQPLVAIALARVLLAEKVDRKFMFWALICIFGGVLISSKDIFGGGLSWSSSFNLGNWKTMEGYLYVLASVVLWGSATVFGKKLTNVGYSQKEIMAGRFTMGFLALLPLMVTTGEAIDASGEQFLKLCVLVAFSGVLAMYFYYKGLRSISARACAIAELYFPLAAIVVNWIILGKTLTPTQITGGVILMIGSLVIQLKHY